MEGKERKPNKKNVGEEKVHEEKQKEVEKRKR